MSLKTGIIPVWLVTSYVQLVCFATSLTTAIITAFTFAQGFILVSYSIVHDGAHESFSKSNKINWLMGCTLISIIPRGLAALGYTQEQPTEDRYLLTRAELLDRLDMLLGGRTAEEIVFGDVSTGAQDDLQRATDLVRHMISRYGMSEVLGLATFETPRPALFLQKSVGGPHEYSEDTARVIDAEI